MDQARIEGDRLVGTEVRRNPRGRIPFEMPLGLVTSIEESALSPAKTIGLGLAIVVTPFVWIAIQLTCCGS